MIRKKHEKVHETAIIFEEFKIDLFLRLKMQDFGLKTTNFFGLKIRKSLPMEMKSSKNANQFKTVIKDWYFENQCACDACNQ